MWLDNSRRIGEPVLTLSPSASSNSSTCPAIGAGTSMAALSLSSVIRASSFAIESPMAICNSITSTSSSVPRSGTSITLDDVFSEALSSFLETSASTASSSLEPFSTSLCTMLDSSEAGSFTFKVSISLPVIT